MSGIKCGLLSAVGPGTGEHVPTTAKQLPTVPFAQKSELTVLLENLVKSYPEGVGIVHEFIQNADDAGATKVWVVLDERRHRNDHLPGPTMDRL